MFLNTFHFPKKDTTTHSDSRGWSKHVTRKKKFMKNLSQVLTIKLFHRPVTIQGSRFCYRKFLFTTPAHLITTEWFRILTLMDNFRSRNSWGLSTIPSALRSVYFYFHKTLTNVLYPACPTDYF